MRANHKSVYREGTADCFGEPNCFWLAIHPRDYINILKPTRQDNSDAKLFRQAVEKWVIKLGEKASRSLKQWQDGWGIVPLMSQSPSPTLDYEDGNHLVELKIHQLTLDSQEVNAIIYEKFLSSLRWYHVQIDSNIRSNSRMLASLLRRMDQVKPFEGVVPNKYNFQLEGDELQMAKSRLSGVLKIDTKFVQKVSKNVASGYLSISEGTEPAKKKQKTLHSEAIPVDLTEKTKPEPLFPLDVLLPQMSQHREPNQPDKQALNSEKVCEPMQTSEAVSVTSAEFSTSTITAAYTSPAKSSGLLSQVISVSSPETPVTVVVDQQALVMKSASQLSTTSSDQMATSCTAPLMSSQQLPHSNDQESVDPVNVSVPYPFCLSSTQDTQLPVTIIDSNQQRPSSSTVMTNPTVSLYQLKSPAAVSHPAGHSSAGQASVLPTSASFKAVRSSVHSPSTFHIMNATGDNWAYDPESPSFPPYIPTPISTSSMLITPDSGAMADDLRSRAKVLLTKGCMPLLPPARRNWTSEEEIKLPLSAPFAWWPPQRWLALSSDMKLMVWESVAMALALKDGFVDMDRGEILDHYNFLALPGSASPQLKSNFQTSRYFNFKVVRDVLLGKSPESESNKQLITMLEAAESAGFKSSTSVHILEQIEKKGISLRVTH